jgi:hypothetical protein
MTGCHDAWDSGLTVGHERGNVPSWSKERTMTIDRVDQTVSETTPTVAGEQTVRTASSRITTEGPEGAERIRRIVFLVFGLIQIVIGLRILLLLLDAREANGLVSGILTVSQWFVGPFDGILRTDALRAAGSILDITAIVALIGWTVVELIVIWALGIFRRERTA